MFHSKMIILFLKNGRYILEYPKQKSSYAEWSIEKTNQQINETENELMQWEQRLRNLNLKSNELKTSTAKLYDRSNFSEESKFWGNNLNKQNGDYDAYDKQFGYSTVYNNKYKNSSCISKKIRLKVRDIIYFK